MPSQEIASFVFVDLETTGLLGQGQKPKITELCMVSIQREEILTRTKFPRVSNKLQLCFNPSKMVSPSASLLTGLFNDSLECQGKFDVPSMDMINTFLSRLPGPVCLLAHNGNKFDFRLLLAESNKVETPFLESLLCADTLEAFQSFGEETTQIHTCLQGAITQQELERTPPKLAQPSRVCNLKRKSFQEFSHVSIAQDTLNISEKDISKAKKHLKFDLGGSSQTLNNVRTTDSRSYGKQITGHVERVITPVFENKTHPHKYAAGCKHDKSKIGVANKRMADSWDTMLIQQNNSAEQISLTSDDSLTDQELLASVLEVEHNSSGLYNVVASTSAVTDNKYSISACSGDAHKQGHFETGTFILPASKFRISYKLEDIYKRTFGSKPPTSHMAECDVISMINVCRAVSSKFLVWTDNNAVPFSTIMPAYS